MPELGGHEVPCYVGAAAQKVPDPRTPREASGYRRCNPYRREHLGGCYLGLCLERRGGGRRKLARKAVNAGAERIGELKWIPNSTRTPSEVNYGFVVLI